MPNYETLMENLKKRGFSVRFFATAEEARAYLVDTIRDKTVGSGGSETIRVMDLLPALAEHNTVHSHALPCADPEQEIALANASQVYLSSVNGLAETGEIINIDGRGNRIASTLYGHETVYFIVGRNKIAPDYDAALYRARNIASPKNAQRLHKNTPCAVRGDRCYDCSSPERICRGLAVLWAPLTGVGRTEVVLVDEDLGF